MQRIVWPRSWSVLLGAVLGVTTLSFPSRALAQSFDLLVASYTEGSVRGFAGDTGAYVGDLIRPLCGDLGTLYGITYGPDGLIYIPDFDHNSIKRFTRSGRYYDTFVDSAVGGLDQPIFCAFGPDANLYVTGYNTGAVYRFEAGTGAPLPASGQPDAVFVPSGTLDASGNRGGALEFGPDGNLYVVSWQRGTLGGVMRFNGLTGDFMDVFVPDGPQAENSWAMTFGPDGNLYVCDYNAACTVRRYSGLDGSYVDDFVSSAYGVGAVYTIAFGPDGNLYATSLGFEGGDDAVRRFSGADGSLIDVVVPAGTGGLASPTGIAFAPPLDIVIGDADESGCVDDADITAVILQFGESCCCATDVSNDGVIDDADLTLVILHYGDGC